MLMSMFFWEEEEILETQGIIEKKRGPFDSWRKRASWKYILDKNQQK